MFPSIAIYNNSIKHQSFVCTQLNDQTVLFITIQFSRSLSFAHNSNDQPVLFDPLKDPIRCYYSGQDWTRVRWQWRGTQDSLKLQIYGSLTIRLFRVTSRTLVGGVFLLCRCSRCILQPEPIGSLVRGVLPLCRDSVGIFYYFS